MKTNGLTFHLKTER